MIKHVLLRAKPSCSDTHEFERPCQDTTYVRLPQYYNMVRNHIITLGRVQYPVQQHTLYLDVAYLREKYSAWAMAS
jgi:hypothetical protein